MGPLTSLRRLKHVWRRCTFLSRPPPKKKKGDERNSGRPFTRPEVLLLGSTPAWAFSGNYSVTSRRLPTLSPTLSFKCWIRLKSRRHLVLTDINWGLSWAPPVSFRLWIEILNFNYKYIGSISQSKRMDLHFISFALSIVQFWNCNCGE